MTVTGRFASFFYTKPIPKEFQDSGRQPSGESDERIWIRDRGRIPKVNAPEFLKVERYKTSTSFKSRHSLEAGFSLVEIMIALIVLGILGGLSFPLLKQQQQAKTLQTTASRQERIFYALAAFINAKGRLPCPTDPYNLAYFGQERQRCQSPEQAQGIIPFETLGLSETSVRDGYQNFFTYVVQPQLTLTRTPLEYCERDIQPLIRFSQAESGSLRFDPIAVLLISHGKLGNGRFIKGKAERVLTIGSGVQQNENVNGDFIFSKKTHDKKNEDILAWETRRNLASFYGRLFCAPHKP